MEKTPENQNGLMDRFEMIFQQIAEIKKEGGQRAKILHINIKDSIEKDKILNKKSKHAYEKLQKMSKEE